MYPDYQDALAVAALREKQLPFYILYNVLTKPSKLHHHDFVEFSIVVKGRGVEWINGEKHIMQPGTVSFLLPHHIHTIQSDMDDPLHLYSCMFDEQILFDSAYDIALSQVLLQVGQTVPSYFHLPEALSCQIIQLLKDMMIEYLQNEYGKDTLLRSKLLEVLVRITRHYMNDMNNLSSGIIEYKQPAHRTIWDVLRFIHLHFSEPLTLKELASHVNWSESYISREFKKLTGMNFVEYVHKLRISRATALLSTTDMSITEISSEVGYDYFRTFSRAFKTLKSITPSEFRKNHL
ncbi:AraC family transcriptional regulator [Paenibacillus nasutitermitis]|uniref:AraC family transcriptional regulator n=1 Tax=Paenibacillus nasutitermitis TaxID=1652958 RepID=A0A916Z768_9BACL|nr:AraC family transcriptional regulator [Paenibacillus nasutitermitis]GGD78413.1 AraC family transcriptional regulator [Paenibacillus nasutitermitis]